MRRCHHHNSASEVLAVNVYYASLVNIIRIKKSDFDRSTPRNVKCSTWLLNGVERKTIVEVYHFLPLSKWNGEGLSSKECHPLHRFWACGSPLEDGDGGVLPRFF